MPPDDSQRPVARRDRGTRWTLLLAGVALAWVQGQTALKAAELPQVLTGINARFEGALPPVVTGNSMVISQVADKATLHWQSFNIGTGGSVEFQQPSSTSVALNRIFDGAPSQIRGQLTANGEVYLINQNGIVFADGAQVNTQSLIASTLNISDRVYQEIGYVNAINDPAGALPAFDSAGQPMGEIRLEPGTTLESAKGGRVLIFAPVIVNEGTIRTPEGQQVLAAAQDRVLIAASESPDLRGLLVEVSTGGSVSNLGSLIAEKGNITLLGLAVNQEGIARATTSVALNGGIRLVAQDGNGTLALGRDLLPRQPTAVRGGQLTLGTTSVTEVIPDKGQTGKGEEIRAVDAQVQPRSRIDMTGSRVELQGGARVTSTGGAINIIAAANPAAPDLRLPSDPTAIPSQVTIGAGAVLDASGDNTTVVPVERNVVQVEARGNELADSPAQRNGPLRNQTLQVDLRKGTPLLNITGAVAGIERSAQERQSAGGTITIRSEGAFSLAEGARLDVSGGLVTYTAGVVSTSRLRQVNGRVVDIANANPNQAYTGVVGTTRSAEAGYVEGRDAGALNIQARGITLEGELALGVTAGPYQRREGQALAGGGTPAFARPWDQAPLAGTLGLNLLRTGLPSIIVGAAGPPGSGAPPLVLPVELIAASGLRQLALTNAGPVLINRPLQLPAWGVLGLIAAGVQILDEVRIPGGQVSLSTTSAVLGGGVVGSQGLLTRIDGVIDLSGSWVNDNPRLNPGRSTAPIVPDGGLLVIGSGASIEISDRSRLDVSAGAWLDNRGRFTGGRGGSISLATGGLELPILGAQLQLGGELRGFGFNGGGSLLLATERLRIVPGSDPDPAEDLSLNATREFDLVEVSDVQGNRQYILEVQADAFRLGGFQSYTLSSNRSDLEITTGSDVLLRAGSLLLSQTAPSLAPTGTSLDVLATPVLLPDFARRPASLTLSADASLGNAIGPVADLRVAAGAALRADAGSRVTLRSTTSLFVEGLIEAPAGTITLQVAGGPGIFQPAQMLWLGPSAQLSADGVALIDTLDPLGRRRGQVLDAGQVILRADQGSLLAAAGSRITADGSTGVLDLGAGIPVPTSVAGAAGTIELRAAEALLYQGELSAAAPAGSTVPGGRLIVRLDPSNRQVPSLQGPDGIPRGPHTLLMTDFTGTLPGRGQPITPDLYTTGYVPVSQVAAGGFAALDVVVRSSAAGTNTTSGVPIPDTPQSLPVIDFPVDLDLRLDRSIVLDAAILRTAGAQVSLTAPYVALGSNDGRVRLDGTVPAKISANSAQNATTPIRLTPTPGPGALAVRGELIELVGEAVTQGFGDAAAGRTGVTLLAAGDVRARGVRPVLLQDYTGLFRTAGNLEIKSGRVYPTTLTGFELAVEGAVGELRLGGGSGVAAAPLSLGGALTLKAAHIVQGGALFAPLGTLNLQAGSSLRFLDGSLTSTAAAGVNAPFFRTEPGGALILPAPSAGEVQIVFVEAVTNPAFERELPQKRINLSAPDIALGAGSRFDLRGGTDSRATEFIPGPGGSRDILLADLDPGSGVSVNPSFAILPAAGTFAPWDPLESPAAAQTQGLRIGDTLVLEGGLPGLPAGEYAILPARYALFGGFLVTPVAGTQDLLPGETRQLLDGTPILAGRYGVAGSESVTDRSQGFAVATGEQVRQRAEYLETALDELYDQGILRAPRDAGNLVIGAADSLLLRGELIRGGTSGGLGSAVDIATTAALSVVNQLTGVNGIELLAADLAGLGADSLLLGGRRTRLADGLAVEAVTGEIRVGAGVDLTQPELILVGNRIVVASSPAAPTRLASTAEPEGRSARLLVTGDEAVLAVSDRQLSLDRGTGAVAGSSSLLVGADVTLAARGALLLDAAGDVNAAGRLEASEGVISLGASGISLGATDGAAIDSGLILSNEALAAIAGADLRLRSSGTIDIYSRPGGDEPLAFRFLGLDARALRGFAGPDTDSRLSATVIELGNSAGSGAGVAPPGAAGSRFTLQADELRLGDGAVAIGGYESTRLEAGNVLLLAGSHTLEVAGDFTVAAPVITAGRTASSLFASTGKLSVATTPGAGAAGTGLGAGLELRAPELDFAGRILLPSGSVILRQSLLTGGGSGSLVLRAGAVIDVAGAAAPFGPLILGTPGGSIALLAGSGDLSLGAARLDVSAGQAGAGAGRIDWAAPAGNVSLGPALVLRADDGAGGSGTFTLDARSLVSAESAEPNGVTVLAGLLGSGDITGSIDLRLREDSLALAAGQELRAGQLRLVADTGSVDIAGGLDASGTTGGSIRVAAGDGVNISGTLLARGTGDAGRGGRVDLYALDNDGDDPAGDRDMVSLLAGSIIDVGGGPGGAGGVLQVHSRRLDSTGDGQTDRLLTGELAGTILGAARTELVATRVLVDPGASQVTDPLTGLPVTQVTVGAGEIAAWRAETGAFLAGLDAPAAGSLDVVPGLLVNSSGNLILGSAWDLEDGWHFGRDLSDPTNPRLGLTGVLSLRAAGNLELRADLSDAFANRLVFGFLEVDALTGAVARRDSTGTVVEQLVRRSWDLRLTAGADLGSADPLATGAVPREFRLNPGVRLRTGTGSIDVAASGDVRLQQGAAIYTAGWDRRISDQLQAVSAPSFGAESYDLFLLFLNGGQYPDGGGDVSLRAGGSLLSVQAPGPVSAWLTRIGSGVLGLGLYDPIEGFGAVPTHWGIAFSQFAGGVGAFGGGNLRLDAGGTVSNVTLAIPTSGRSLDGVVADTTGGRLVFLPSNRTTELLGGGTMTVNAGGGVTGAQVVLGQGSGSLRSGGDPTAVSTATIYTGSRAQFDWVAAGGVTLSGLLDPTVVDLSPTQLTLMRELFSIVQTTGDIANQFYTYTPDTGVRVASLGGDVALSGPGFNRFLPPSLRAVSYSGDVNVVATPIVFFPSPVGQLELLAARNVTGNFFGSVETRLSQSDQDPGQFPRVERPDIVVPPGTPARVPVHTGDPVPNLIVAREGSVQSRPGNPGYWTLELAKPTLVQAGTDISSMSIRVQHIDANALSSFEAGRDIVQRNLRTNTGRFATNDRRIFEIWGPGSAEFLAGRDIALGTSSGIETVGNLKNAALAPAGASLRLLGGISDGPDYGRFIEVYLSADASNYRDELNNLLARIDAGRDGFPVSSTDRELPIPPGLYQKELLEFLAREGIPAGADPAATFGALSAPLQRAFITELVFAELKDWGSAAETADRADRLNYVRGFTALDTLFAQGDPLGVRAGDFPPGSVEQLVQAYLTIRDPQAANDAQVALFGLLFPPGEPRGDISLLLSQVQTLAGGDLSMLAVAGSINAGAADADIIAKAPADLGIVTARGGDINIGVDRDLLVNSTRVFALQGDLLIWSSNGSIDAGKGAKTVTSVPNPITRIDPNTGQTIIEFPPAVAGSGLQGENAALFAPRGAVNAGDAGIRTSGDLTIGAVEVIGSDNIDVGGIEVGFSTSDVVAVAPPAADSATSAATRGLDSQAAALGDADDDGERTIQGTQVSFITVEVLSFGSGCDPDDEDCRE